MSCKEYWNNPQDNCVACGRGSALRVVETKNEGSDMSALHVPWNRVHHAIVARNAKRPGADETKGAKSEETESLRSSQVNDILGVSLVTCIGGLTLIALVLVGVLYHVHALSVTKHHVPF